MRFNTALMAAAVSRKRRMMYPHDLPAPDLQVALFNNMAALDPDGGATVRIGWRWNMGPAYQTITPNGGAPGGYGYSSKIENFLAPGDGNHLQPNGLNGGAGAACVSSGRIEGSGLYLPNTASKMASFVGHQDPASAVGLANTVPNNFMQDATAGYTVAMFHHYAGGRKFFSFKKADGTNEHKYGDIRSHRSMRDPVAGLGIPVSENGPKSKVLLSVSHALHTQTLAVGFTGGNVSFEIQEGSLISDAGSDGTLNYLATDRDFHLLADGGLNATGSSGNLGVYMTWLMSGRPNKFQMAYLRTIGKGTNWDSNPYWVDRYRLAHMGGDSMEFPNAGAYIDREGGTYSHLDHIMQGYQGRPPVDNMVMTCSARSGHTPAEFQEAFWRIFDTLDTSDRPLVIAFVWEMLNSGNYANNKTLRSIVKAYNPATRVWSFDTWGVANNTHDWDAEQAARVADGWDGCLAMNRMQLWDPAFWRNGLAFDPGGPVLEIYDSSRHWQLITWEHSESFWAIISKLAAGEDCSGMSMEVVSNPPTFHLTSATPTETPAWSVKNYLGQTLVEALHFESTNSSIVTVANPSGLITAVAVGEAGVRAISAKGAMGMHVVFVDSVPVIPPDTTTNLIVDLTFEADTLADTSGSGLDFTAIGAPTYEATGAGAAGSRAIRVATADGFMHAMVTALQLLRAGHTAFAICMAVKPRDFSGVPFYMECTNFLDILDTGGNGALLARIFSSGGATVGSVSKSNGTFTANAWNFLAIQVDTVANTMTLYWNAGSTTVSLTGTPNAAPSANLNFFCQGASPANFLKNGSAARVKIFDGLKTPNDIAGVKTEFGM